LDSPFGSGSGQDVSQDTKPKRTSKDRLTKQKSETRLARESIAEREDKDFFRMNDLPNQKIQSPNNRTVKMPQEKS
jgi:hypothetical protein